MMPRIISAAIFTLIAAGQAAAASAVTVPYLYGLTKIEAAAVSQRAGLQSAFYRPSATAAIVVAQVPTAGANVAHGTRIQAQLGDLPASVAVPNLYGLTKIDAVAVLQKAGLRPIVSGQNTAVHTQLPRPGVVVGKGTVVQLQ